MTNSPSLTSPPWPPTLKMVAGLTMVGLVAALLIYFRSIIGPLLLAFILTYLLHPVAVFIAKKTRLSWKASANLIFLLLVIILISASTLAGVMVVQQVQSLIRFMQRFIYDLPNLLEDLSTRVYSLGPFKLDVSQFLDLDTLGDQLIQAIQPLIGRAGTLVSSFASGAASMLGWLFFTLLVAYFLLSDSGQVPDAIQYIRLPGYDADVRRIAHELGRIWNSFLRGQLLIVLMVIFCYAILLTALGVRYAVGIAILAGLARFFPYIGPLISNSVTILVAILQPSNYFGLAPVYFACLAFGCSIIMDQIFDNMVSPRLLGQTLGVHPAAVMVAALIAANLIGIVGIVLAAPVLASFKLLSEYFVRKMFDLEPWPEPAIPAPPIEIPGVRRGIRNVRAWLRLLLHKRK